MNIVIVESPAKAKTIEKYLGKDYKVLASYGHIRDLPSKDGSVDVDQDFNMVWETSSDGKKRVKAIADALQGAKKLYLATDPDREGEAIAWHVYELLKSKKALKDIGVQRIVFNEITKKAVSEALAQPRDINQSLVEAYLARRALDYLVGFNLSPVLWRKLPGSKSAGRVQSVALRLIVEREHEIEAFKPQEYWSIVGSFIGDAKKTFEAKLTKLKGKKLEKFSLTNEKQAKEIVALAEKAQYQVASIEKKQVKRHPAPPFITSTLQQEASRKLGFSATKTMTTAQKLYEGIDVGGETVGLITYMRTDSVVLSQEALEGCRKHIDKKYGQPYLPKAPRVFKRKVKNAQEAHEAIRPTSFLRAPETLKNILSVEQYKLYELIWKRTVASQMESALLDQVAVDVLSHDQAYQFRATGNTVAFDGFLRVYEEGKDTSDDEDQEKRLPLLKESEKLLLEKLIPHQHFTQPPPRYSEATLVKTLEELGIGRPSTYASIIHVLQSRDYVRLEKRVFFPEERGILVATFLENFFKQYVEYTFTADLEDRLDDIADQQKQWKEVLKKFWQPFKQVVDETQQLKNAHVLDVLNEELKTHLFGEAAENQDCPECQKGKLHLKLSRFGAFIGCERYPECNYTKKLKQPGQPEEKKEEMSEHQESEYPKTIGQDEATQAPITLRKGPYGFYLQVGEMQGKEKPKRVGLPRSMHPDQIDIKAARKLLSLPFSVGVYPGTEKEMLVGIGRYGPYIKYDGAFYSVKKDNILTLSTERAIEIINEKKK